MRNGIAGAVVPLSLQYADEINRACVLGDFSPMVAYAVKWNETAAMPNATTVISGDDGHGLFQITPEDWWTPEMVSRWASIDWTNPYSNALFAVDYFLVPAETYWQSIFQGEDLVRAIAAEFNAGRTAAIDGHREGNLDKYTTKGYAARALATYLRLLSGEAPE